MIDQEHVTDLAKLEAQRKKARGERAREIMDDPLIEEVFEILEQQIYSAWANTTFDQIAVREEAVRMGRCLTLFKSQFELILREGRDAEVMIAHEGTEQ